MKNLIILITLMFSFNASAGIGWLLLGAALSESGKKTVVVQKTEFEIKIDQIKNALPASCSPNQSVYSSCWKSYNKPVIKVYADHNSVEAVSQYFKNLGYKVRSEGTEISFNFEDEYKKYLAHQKVFISIENMLLLGLFSAIILFFLYLRHGSRKRASVVKAAYEKNKDDLIFHYKSDQEKFEESLKRLSVPVSWNPIITDGKLTRITYYNGSSMGIIASSRALWAESLKALSPKKMKPTSLGPVK